MTGSEDLARALAAHAVTVKSDAVDEPAWRAVKTFILDTLGVGIAGAAGPLTGGVRRAAAGFGGPGPAHILGPGAAGGGVSPGQAAFVNGFQIHCQEFDCVHEPAVVHPMASVFAALLAEAERLSAMGRPVAGVDFALAVIVAVDGAVGLGVAATTPLKFFRPATAGVFGASLGIARLRGFRLDQARAALGCALGFASGTMQAHTEGKPLLPVQIANAARNAQLACDLVEHGVEGAVDALEGLYGYLPLFETGFDAGAVRDGLGRIWRIAEVSHKPYPTGRAAQGGIRMMQALHRDGVRASDVAAVTLTAPPLIERLVGRPARADMDAPYARLCFAYSGAAALMTGDVGLADFSPEALGRQDRLDLAGRICVVSDGSEDPAAFTPQTLRVTLHSGVVAERTIHALYGSTADPLTHDENVAKFRACVAFGLGDGRSDVADAMAAQVDQLESITDVAVFARTAAGMTQEV